MLRWPTPLALGLSATALPQEHHQHGKHYTYKLYAELCEAADRAQLAVENITWTTEHFQHVAEQQNSAENPPAPANPLVDDDTDAFATALWEHRYVVFDIGLWAPSRGQRNFRRMISSHPYLRSSAAPARKPAMFGATELVRSSTSSEDALAELRDAR